MSYLVVLDKINGQKVNCVDCERTQSTGATMVQILILVTWLNWGLNLN